MMLRAAKRFMTVLGGFGVAILFAAGTAQAANPACGATVTHDVKLTSDMNCSASNTDGVIVGKSGITINLNGHTLTGPGSGSYYGIDDSGGSDHITLENGTVAGYDYDVVYEYTTGSKIEHVHAGSGGTGDVYGIYYAYSAKGEINHSTAEVGYTSSNYPFYLYDNTNVNLLNSKVANPNSSSYGVYDYYNLDQIDNVKSNGGYYGFYVEYPIHGSEITDSAANGNSGSGFYIYEDYPAFFYQTTLSHDTANNNGDYGFYADLTAPGKKNHASGNTTANCHHVKCSH